MRCLQCNLPTVFILLIIPVLQLACMITRHEISMLLHLIGVISSNHTQHVYLQTKQLRLKGLLPSAGVSVDTRR